MKKYTVDASMEAGSARDQLQRAIDHIYSVYEIIGAIPYSKVSGDADWRRLAQKFDSADRLMEELATDPIPF